MAEDEFFTLAVKEPLGYGGAIPFLLSQFDAYAMRSALSEDESRIIMALIIRILESD
jgi:hypothetical protein